MKRFEVWLTRLDPTEGAEMQKTRPVVILSPDEMNGRLMTVLAAPLTTGGFQAPFRVPCSFSGVQGQVALDHLRSVSKTRLIRRIGVLEAEAGNEMLAKLRDVFAK